MGVVYELIDLDAGESYDLGKGYWHHWHYDKPLVVADWVRKAMSKYDYNEATCVAVAEDLAQWMAGRTNLKLHSDHDDPLEGVEYRCVRSRYEDVEYKGDDG